MSNEINDLADEKNLPQGQEITVSVDTVTTKAERSAENKRKLLESITADQAINLALSQAHKKEMELETGSKLTRKERGAMLRDMAESIQACANIGYRIKQGQRPEDEMIEKAMAQPGALEDEIRGAAHLAPELAIETAQRAGMENLAAALATVATAETSAHVGADQASVQTVGQDPENQAADLAPVATATDMVPPQHRQVAASQGRPSTFTVEEGDRICAWIQSGKSLNSYCRKYGRQASTVYAWMRDPSPVGVAFAKNYACAHEDRADTLVEDMLDIADGMATAHDMTQVMAGKLRIETRKWIAERMRPQKYGQKVEVQQTGRVTFNLGVPRANDAQIVDINPVQTALDKP